MPDHKKDYLSRENIDNYLELINNAIASVTEERIVGYLEEIKINILYSIMNEKDLNYGRKKAAFDEFCSLVEKLDIEKPSEFGISMDEYIRKVFPRRLKRCSFFSHLCNERGTFMHFKRTNIAPLKSATGKKNKMPFSDIALNLEYKGVSVTDDSHWYWCVSPIYDENNSVHLFCSRWRTSEKGMALWSSESEIVHFVGNSPEGPFNYVETVLSNDNIPFPEWQAAPHNPQIYKFEEQYALVYIVQDKRVKNGGMKTGLMLSDSLNGPWHFAGNDGIVVKESTDKTHWTYHSKTGTENPAMAKIDDTYYIFFKAGKAQNRKMHYGYATSKSIEGPYIMCNEPKMDNIHYVEDATAFQQNGKTYLLTTDNFGKNTGIFGAGILWKMRDGYFKRENAEIGFGVLSDYTDLPGTATFCDNDRSTKLERPGILMKNGKPEYFYGCTRTDVFGSGKSQCYVFKINFKEK